MQPRTGPTIRAELDALQAQARQHNALYNEGGEGYNPYAQQIAVLQAVLDALDEAELNLRLAVLQAAEEAEWSREVTIARRAEWNTWVRSHGPGSMLSPLAVQAQIDRQGWSIAELRTAIKRHGL